MDNEKITVLVVEPEKKPYVKDIDPGLASLQKEVGGYIQAVYPFEELVAIICDEEGKLKGSMLNRALLDEEGHIYDIVAGTFLVVGLTEDDFGSLTDEYVKQFTEHFKTPETFMRINGKLVVLPVEEKLDEVSRPSITEQINGAKGKENRDAPEKGGREIDEIER